MPVSVNPTCVTGFPCPQSTHGSVLTIFVLYIEVYIINKTLCEYEPNQTTDYAVNPGLIMSKTPVDNGCFNLVVCMKQQQTTGRVDNGYCQFQPVAQCYLYN